ncbi:MAG: bifunctional 4-hydroxy-2-oxoglutarate aldolase/2-dehydro-3-deoxy-phosphogluconate aldolase, partial [Lachnospiraceae bacterium]|nr:bifunctional 4-hydroxy-2-oxoglutarate aldolase/2-dehydro-3-deoxy-phosphogluconate aldolase [Lachnospiraceae bacterium]
MEEAIKRFSEVGIIPVVVLNDAKDAEPLGQALMEGGLPAAEVTFRTDAAEESIRIMSEKFPDMLVGAGTVLTIDQAERAIAAGAKFIVSPGFDPEIVQFCLDRDIPVCPGVQTPTEVIQAYKFGLDHVKFFPAENAGGLAMIKAVGAAFPNMK